MKNLIVGILVLVVVGGAWLAYNAFTAQPSESAGENLKAESAPEFSWKFAEAGEDETTGAPRTSVTLVADDEDHALGTFMGSCAVIDGTGWELAAGEITGVICYFAGGGDELGVFTEGDGYVVKKGVVEEGSAEVMGFRGNYETVLALQCFSSITASGDSYGVLAFLVSLVPLLLYFVFILVIAKYGWKYGRRFWNS